MPCSRLALVPIIFLRPPCESSAGLLTVVELLGHSNSTATKRDAAYGGDDSIRPSDAVFGRNEPCICGVQFSERRHRVAVHK